MVSKCVDCGKLESQEGANLRKFRTGLCAYCGARLKPVPEPKRQWSWGWGPGTNCAIFYHPLGYVRTRYGYTHSDAQSLVDYLNSR